MGSHICWTREQGTLWVCDLESAAPAPVQARRTTIFREIDREMCEQLSAVMGFADPQRVMERLKAGRRCFVALLDGAIASYAWASRGCEHVGELERVFILPESECYIWDCATVRAHRGQRLYAALLSHVLFKLKREGVRRVWIGAARANRPSIRGIVLAGFSPAVTTHYVRLWQLRYLRVARHPSATPALTADAFRLIAGRDERKVGSILIGMRRRLDYQPLRQPCD
jgi:GNAT superfamily N-acetyltransferase